MSIFKRQNQDGAEQASATLANDAAKGGQPAPATKVMQQPVTPGVVPPPAAPIYSMRQPEAAARLREEAQSLAEKLAMAKEALERSQVSLEGSVKVATQRESRTTVSPGKALVRRRPALPATVPPRATRPQVRSTFDAVRAAQTGLLNLAWSWQQAGAPIRAINAYMQVLQRYPDTAAADAAVADLVEISESLAENGQFHLALAIYDELEHLA